MSRIPGAVAYDWLEALRKEVAGWDKDQCSTAWDVIRERDRQLSTAVAQKQAAQFHVGQRVQFRSRKRGGAVITGTIERINTKTIALTDCSDGSPGWRVAPALLEPATEVIAPPKGVTVTDITAKIGHNDPGDILEVVISNDGTASTFIHRRDFGKREWDLLQAEARKNALFGNKERKLYGGECVDCKAQKKLLVEARKVSPECVSLKYRCVGCGAEDSDVAD